MIESIETQPELWKHGAYSFYTGVDEYTNPQIKLWVANGYRSFRLDYPVEQQFKTEKDKKALWEAIKKHKKLHYTPASYYRVYENLV